MTVSTVAISDTNRGTTVANNGNLNNITLTAVPTAFDPEYFCLVDDAGGERTLFNIHISTSHVSIDTVLMSDARIDFTNLTVKSIPAGCTFDLGVDV